ncbi:MAG: hypothetical protein KatS3mg068_2136 [Candidatus Sericytochromatia bacterium]|nr:MAG: hypothetical protein KatS3mg068_2136 [Candidatus Sericytochromatia bacterium]
MVKQDKPWYVCAESGIKFQFPNGAQCVRCKKYFSTKYYLYVDMEPVCLKCRKAELDKIIKGLKMANEI